MKFLPYGHQVIEDDDIAAVTAVLRGDYLTTGPAVQKFEQAFARKVGAPFAVSCSSGTAALHLATMAAGLAPGDRAVVPAVTFLATANAVRFVGAEVIFADVDPDTGLMSAAHLEAALARADGHVRTVLPVHLAGQCEDLPAIRAIAQRVGASVIEDACHALGADYTRGNGLAPIGSCADCDMAAFSFHPVKTVTMGEGGAVTTTDPALAERLARLRNHGMVRDPDAFQRADLGLDTEGAANPWYYEMHEPGYNYRASDIHCALGLSQLAKLDRFVTTRRALADSYDRLLKPLAPVVRPLARTPGCRPAWHLYVVLIDFSAIGRSRAWLMRELHKRGIGSQVHYIPVSRQPYFRKRYGDVPVPGADLYYERCLSLPLFPGMSEEDVGRVVAALTEII